MSESTKPKFQVVETNLHFRPKAGGEIVLNLDVPFGVLLDASQKTDSEQEQFLLMLEALGDKKTLDQIRKLGSLEALPLVTRFFEEFERLLGASVGEAQRSSGS